MSFEMQYDKNGKVIPQPELANVATDEPTIEPVAAQETTDEIQEAQETETLETEAPEPVTPIKKTPADSIRDLRAAKDEAKREAELARKERDAYYQRIQELERMKSANAAPVQEEDLSFDLKDDDLAEGKHLSKVDKKIKNLENKLRQYEEQSALTATELRLKNQFADFDSVVSRTNIDALMASYPELAETLLASPDLYKKGVSAYTLIKNLGIHKDETKLNEDRERVLRNAAKPRPLVSGAAQQGDSPLSHANAFANGLTEDLKKQMQREMNAARKAL